MQTTKLCSLHSRHIDIFFNWLNPCFWAKIGNFVLVCFGTKWAQKQFLMIIYMQLKKNQALLDSNIRIMAFSQWAYLNIFNGLTQDYSQTISCKPFSQCITLSTPRQQSQHSADCMQASPVSQSASQLVNQPASQSVSHSVSQLVSQSASQSFSQSVSQSVSHQPVGQSVIQPVSQLVSQPESVSQ